MDSKINASIEQVIEKFPQLDNSKRIFGNEYQLVRSVKNGKYDFEIRLFSESDSIEGKQKVIVFINSKNECYTIPFFSNKYKDYWLFPFDKQIPNIRQTNSSFSYELNIAITNLGLNDYPHKEGGDYIYECLMNELFLSILNCIKLDELQEKDSTLICSSFYQASDMPTENMDSAHVRLRKNYELMKKEWGPGKNTNIWGYNCYFDRENGRIYQINYDKNKIDIKNYRQNVGFEFITF